MELFDWKFVVVAVLFLALTAVKLLAGGRPWDNPVRRSRRFGYRGSLSPLRNEKPGQSPTPELKVVEESPRDPEEEFFGKS